MADFVNPLGFLLPPKSDKKATKSANQRALETAEATEAAAEKAITSAREKAQSKRDQSATARQSAADEIAGRGKSKVAGDGSTAKALANNAAILDVEAYNIGNSIPALKKELADAKDATLTARASFDGEVQQRQALESKLVIGGLAGGTAAGLGHLAYDAVKRKQDINAAVKTIKDSLPHVNPNTPQGREALTKIDSTITSLRKNGIDPDTLAKRVGKSLKPAAVGGILVYASAWESHFADQMRETNPQMASFLDSVATTQRLAGAAYGLKPLAGIAAPQTIAVDKRSVIEQGRAALADKNNAPANVEAARAKELKGNEVAKVADNRAAIAEAAAKSEAAELAKSKAQLDKATKAAQRAERKAAKAAAAAQASVNQQVTEQVKATEKAKAVEKGKRTRVENQIKGAEKTGERRGRKVGKAEVLDGIQAKTKETTKAKGNVRKGYRQGVADMQTVQAADARAKSSVKTKVEAAHADGVRTGRRQVRVATAAHLRTALQNATPVTQRPAVGGTGGLPNPKPSKAAKDALAVAKTARAEVTAAVAAASKFSALAAASPLAKPPVKVSGKIGAVLTGASILSSIVMAATTSAKASPIPPAMQPKAPVETFERTYTAGKKAGKTETVHVKPR